MVTIPVGPKYPQISAMRHAAIRILIAANLLLGIWYISWRYTSSVNWAAWWIALPLLVAETYSFLDSCLFGLTIWRLKRRGAAPSPPEGMTVDVLITCYNEPVALVRETARAARAIRYPHRTYVLDDGDSPAMRAMAAEEGIGYITRSSAWQRRSRHAKAGNLNNALFQTTGELLLILDADQLPRPEILDPHAVADDLAAAELHLLAIGGEILLDLDDELGIGEPHAVAGGRAEHVGIGGARDLVGHGCSYRVDLVKTL
jgi:cellulose synthase (UDP-forming)